jgi:mandelate racemase
MSIEAASNPPLLTIRALRAVAVEVPMTYALGTSRATVSAAPLLLVDLETEEGITGHSYLFCYLRAAAPAIVKMLEDVEQQVRGARVSPAELWGRLAKRFTLIGVQGIVRMAMSALDVAAWDALALAAGMPLVRLLGMEPRPIAAYNSCGLGLKETPEAVADEAEKLLGDNFRAVKLRLGYPTWQRA